MGEGKEWKKLGKCGQPREGTAQAWEEGKAEVAVTAYHPFWASEPYPGLLGSVPPE